MDQEDPTRLHRAATLLYSSARPVVQELFATYRSFDVNHTDVESGLTHFHIACKFGCEEVVRKFLEHGQDPNLVARDTVDPPLHLALLFGHENVARLLLRYRADPNLADKNGSTALHVICEKHDDDVSWTNMLFEMCDQENLPSVQVNAKNRLNQTPLHSAVTYDKKEVAEVLLERGADPNSTDSEGRTPLHIICAKAVDDGSRKSMNFVKEFLKMSEDVSINAQDTDGNTPLHLAVEGRHASLAKLLLDRDADPNLANEKGSTALHIGCERFDDTYLVGSIFDKSSPRIDAQDKSGNTPLHLALLNRHSSVAEFLLWRGADPTLINGAGSTALHLVCERNDDLAQVFFRINRRNPRQRVRLDALDNLGWTPLNVALRHGNEEAAKSVLRAGADPNGETPNPRNQINIQTSEPPLNLICQGYVGDDFVEQFFRIGRDLNKTVKVDVQGVHGRTPLQWAVASILPKAVDALLSRGADVSRFVFPTEDYFAKRLKSTNEISLSSKFKLASGVLLILESLTEKGYILQQNDTLQIMKLFADQRMFEEPLVDLEQPWYEDKAFKRISRRIKVNADLSLYHLIRMRPKEASRQLTFRNYYELGCSTKLDKLPVGIRDACDLHLCEKLAKGFFCKWALEPFCGLIHYQFAIELCEIILVLFTNQDLYNICLTAVIRSSR